MPSIDIFAIRKRNVYCFSTVQFSRTIDVVNDLVQSLCSITFDGESVRHDGDGNHHIGVCHQVSHTDYVSSDGDQKKCLDDRACLPPRGWFVNLEAGMSM